MAHAPSTAFGGPLPRSAGEDLQRRRWLLPFFAGEDLQR